MKKLILLLLLIVGCEEVLEPEDCAGFSGGPRTEDDCGVCQSPFIQPGDNLWNATCLDCLGEPNGMATFDVCEVCDGDGADEGYDCDGNCTADIDCAGVCGGSAVEDCAGECGGSAVEDEWGKNVELWGECYNIEETTYLELNNSGLTGEIPSEIGNLTNLTDLGLKDNQLTGDISQQVCDLIENNNLYIPYITNGNNLTNTCD